MAGHGWRDWFEREEFIGQISDIRVQNLQVEREVVQKRTFTRWMNLHLEKCDPPMEVHDLFRDIQDGRILMALLEELSGCKLLHGFKKSSHRIFRLNNIAKVLSFLEERNVKLVSIDAADVADGNSSIVLGLIWNIILFFQIKELTGNIRSQFPSSSSLSSIPTSSDSDTSYSSTPSEERRPSSGAIRDHGKPIKKLLQWVQKRTRKYGVAVQDFGKSWTSGLAFLAVIKSIDSSLVDMRRALLRTARENLEDAFRTAHYSLGIPRLLEPEDVTINSPDEQSIMTYVSQFLEHFPGIEEPEEACQVIERSISMGRLSSCDSDFDQTRNGIFRSHLRERPYTVRKDWVQPPPKIFISSVSEDRGFMSPTSPSAGARSWASEDSLVGSTPIKDRSTSVGGDPHDPGREVFTISNANSPVSESVNSESVIGDSAISSPDSWVESEVGAMQDRFGESRSDSFRCDNGTAWDVGVLPATPEEVTTLDEGLMPSKVERPPKEQSIPELFIDEGIYLSSSLESTQERIQAQCEKEEEEKQVEKEANRYLRDLNQDRAPTHVPGQNEAERKALQKDQVSSERQPSLRLSDATEQTNSGVVHSLEPNGTNQSQSSSSLKPLTLGLFEERNEQEASSHTESECAKEAVEFSGDSQVCEGQLNVETKSVSERNSYEELEMETGFQKKDSLSDKEREERGILKERDEEAVENEAPNKMSCTSNEHNDNEDPESALCLLGGLLSEKVKPIASEQTREIENGHLDDINQYHTVRSSNTNPSGSEAIDNVEISETQQKCGSPHHDHSRRARTTPDETETESLVQPASTDAERHLDPSDQDTERNSTDQLNVQDKLGTSFPANETAIAQQNIPDPANSRSNGKTGTTCYEPTSEAGDMDLFYADRSSPSEDLVSDLIDPMDLFYPDKEESMFTEPPDREIKSHLSVLSVSALQPAPASETLPEAQPPNQLGEDVRTGVPMQEQEKEIPETHRGADTSSEPREQCLLPMEGAVAGWGVSRPTEGSDLSQAQEQSPASARENMEPMRSKAKGSRRQDESPVPTAAHRRKVPSSVESADNHMTASTTGTQCSNSDPGPSEGPELYLLLLLWLLIYCLLLLPQMDLKTLPGLLLNLDH